MIAAPDLDLHCVECRYNLRGLARDALCPECGSPAERSFLYRELDAPGVGVPLRLADSGWVRSLARACTTLGVVGLGVAASGVLTIFPVALALSRPVLLALFAVLEFAAWAPVWRLARPEPGAPAERHRFLRYSIAAAVTACMLVVHAMIFAVVTGRIDWVTTWPLRSARIITSALAAGLTFAYLRRLARRAEAVALPRAALALAIAAPALLLLQLIPALTWFRLDSPSGPAVYGVLPTHVFGHSQVLPLFVWAIVARASLGFDHVAWALMTVAGPASVAFFFWAGRVFARVLRTRESGAN